MLMNLFSGRDSRYSSSSLKWRFGLGGIAFVIAMCYGFFFGASSYVRAYESIKPGMGVNQVLKLMGPAKRDIYDGRGQRELYWKVVSKGGRGRRTTTYHFYVYIDDVGAVLRKTMRKDRSRY